MLQTSRITAVSFAANLTLMRRRIPSFIPAFIVLFLTAAVPLVLNAQDTTQHLSLSEAITATLNNNKSLSIAQLEEAIAASNYKQTEAIFLPQVGFSYTAFTTNNPLNAFGFKLQQQSITQADFNPVLLNKPGQTSDFATKLDIQQPLLNMEMLYKRKAAAKQKELYLQKTQRTKEYLSYEAEKAYLQLQLAYEAVTVLEEALKTADAVYRFTENQFKQGFIQKSDLLNAQVQKTNVETSLSKAYNNIGNASDLLSFMMGQQTSVRYTVDPSPAIKAIPQKQPAAISTTRADFVTLEKAIEASTLMIQSAKNSRYPKLNAFGSFQLNDNSMFGFGAKSYFAGIQLSWDLFKGNSTRNSMATQNLERDKMTKQLSLMKEQSQLELHKAERDLQDAANEMKQQEASIEQATEAFQILQNRYQQGLVRTTDVLQASTQVMQLKFNLAQTLFNYKSTYSYIQFLTSSTTK